jgi:hypothetical protein
MARKVRIQYPGAIYHPAAKARRKQMDRRTTFRQGWRPTSQGIMGASAKIGCLHRRQTRSLGVVLLALLVFGIWVAGGQRACAQSATFAGNAQHTAQYAVPAQHLNRVRWSAAVDSRAGAQNSHYAGPLITAANTVLLPVRGGLANRINAYDGQTGRLKYILTNDFRFPPTSLWEITYNPVLVSGPSGPRLYYAGAGGTVYYVDNVDSDTPGAPVQICFYMALADYQTNTAAFATNVFVNTPLTADNNGTVFYGFRVSGTAAAPLSTTNGGFVRIDPQDNAQFVLAPDAAGDPLISRDSHNCAPALSNEGSTLYVVAKASVTTRSYLLGLDSSTLATKYKVLLHDPGVSTPAQVTDSSTASPMVGPDGDVFFGVIQSGGFDHGVTLHFSGDLATVKIPSAFGWDYTGGVVPASMVPGYTGTSSYLLFSKYNNYNSLVHRVALLDPNAVETDSDPADHGLQAMREVFTVTCPTPQMEWCINSCAVNPATASVFAPSEDGRIYCWNLFSNSLAEAFTLGAGVGEPYVPTLIGPDGAVYTISGGTLFVLDSQTNVVVTAASSAPDLNSVLLGQSLVFTATVANVNPADPLPTGTVTFMDGAVALATNVPLNGGVAAITNATLAARAHFINAVYSGDATFPAASNAFVQRIHSRATTIALTSRVAVPGSNSVTFTATVTSPSGGTPTGMATFYDGTTFLAELPLTNNHTSFTMTNLPAGSHAIQAQYSSDTTYAASRGSVVPVAPSVTSVSVLPDGSFQLGFTNVAGAPFSVIGTPDWSLDPSLWPVIGPVTEISPGIYQFTDPQAAIFGAGNYYRVRSP